MMTLSINDNRFALLLAAAAGFAAACDGGSSGQAGSGQAQTVASAVNELERGVSACAEQHHMCLAQAGDASTDTCRADFESCRAAADAAAGPQIEHAANTCATKARACREAAQTSDAKAACTEQLRECTGADKMDTADGSVAADAGQDEDHAAKSPVRDCILSLHACIDGDDPAKVCTTALRACIGAAVGNGHDQDGGRPDHAGNPDAGKPDHAENPDAAKPEHPSNRPDGGVKQHDDADTDDDQDESYDGGSNGKPDVGNAGSDAGAAGEAAACRAAYDACVASGEDREVCARSRKDCRE